jgi:Mg2+/citrate symporter
MLMRHVLDMADAEGRTTYIEATSAGYPLYLKLGFREIDAVVVDLSSWGAKKKGLNTIMLRDPHPVKQVP